MKKPTRKRRAVDPFAAMLKAAQVPLTAEYRPMVGYLYANGDVQQFSSTTQAWFSFDRAVSSCFGSAAKRMRGTWDADFNQRGVIVAFVMLVVDGRNRIAWKQRVDIPERAV